MSTTPTRPPTPIDASPLDDAHCIRCGYDLRGLDPAGDCPECGLALERSLGEIALIDADPAWLAQVRWGLVLVAFGPLVTLIAFLTVIAGGLARLAIFAFEDDLPIDADLLRTIMDIGADVLGWAGLGGVAAACLGAFLLGAREPARVGRDPWHEPRSLARWLLVVIFTVLVADRVVGGMLPPPWDVVRDIVQAAAIVGGYFVMRGILEQMTVVAVRSRAALSVKRCRDLTTFFAKSLRTVLVAQGMIVVGTVAETFLDGQGQSAQIWSSLSAVIAGIGWLIFVITVFISVLRVLSVSDVARQQVRIIRTLLRQGTPAAAPAPVAAPAPAPAPASASESESESPTPSPATPAPKPSSSEPPPSA